MKALLSRWRTRGSAPRTEARIDDEVAAAVDLTVALYTDVGPVREHNEDCIAALNAPWPGRPGDRTSLVALADGMGGHLAGELASRLAIEAAMQTYGQLGGATADRLQAALAAANRAVYERACGDAAAEGMGTTLVLFAPSDSVAHYAWVGDSRLYLERDGELNCLTQDDTLVHGLLSRGLIGADEIAGHPDQSVLTQAVGTHEAIPAPHVLGPIALRPGDRFLLCSDGIHDVVEDAQLNAVLRTTTTPDAAMQQILALALRNGANDNLSIGVIDVAIAADAAMAAQTTRRTRPGLEVLP